MRTVSGSESEGVEGLRLWSGEERAERMGLMCCCLDVSFVAFPRGGEYGWGEDLAIGWLERN